MPSKSWLRRFEVNENHKTTVYLLGDSITQGLGSKKVNFTGKLADLLGEGYEIVNLAYTGTTIDYALGLLDEGKIAPGGSLLVRRALRQRGRADTAEPEGQGVSSHTKALPGRRHADAKALLLASLDQTGWTAC